MKTLNQYQAEVAAPNASSIINSYRSFGYDLNTALADILDNSLSANATSIWIDFTWNGADSSISILDNGEGMSKEELILAMTPGSKNPDDQRPPKDLGRFGLGLKTASFSQCKTLSVATKQKERVLTRSWDIDYINEVNKWILLDYISESPSLERLTSFNSGTLVHWTKLDRIVGNSTFEDLQVKSFFYQALVDARKHLGLVFHKFIENNEISIYINEELIDPINPFLYNLSIKPEMGPKEQLGRGVFSNYFILPHMSRISDYEYEQSGGPKGWFDDQGFYLYRENRLLIGGSWLGIKKNNEYSKLARIEINFSNSNDFDWALDIKKSTATPPQTIRKELKRIAEVAIKKSMQVYNYRGASSIRALSEYKLEPIWIDETLPDGSKTYKLNRKNIIVSKALESATPELKKFIKIMEKNVPVDLIIYNQNEDPKSHESLGEEMKPSQEITSLAKDIHKINMMNGKSYEESLGILMSTSPFNMYPILTEILKDE